MNLTALNLGRCCVGLLLLAAPAVVAVATEPATRWSMQANIVNAQSSGTVSGFTLDDDESGGSLGVGYSLNKHLTVQALYNRMGKHFATDCPPPLVCVTTNIDEVDITGLSMAAIGAWPITSVFEVYGKLGVMYWDADFQQFPRNESDPDILYGAGIGIWLAPNWRLSLQYEKVDDFDLESAGLGLAYRF